MNLKDCFNSALSGTTVLIERGGVTYRLTAEVGSPAKPEPKITIVPSDFKNSKITRLDNGSCKIHGMPLTVYGKCLVKGCKNG